MTSTSTSNRGHRQIDHTADLAIQIWGPDEAALLIEGAQAVVEVMTDGAEIRADSTRDVELETVDAEDRLVQWLNEVIWLALGDGFLASDAAITLHEGGLSARVCGESGAGSRLTTELKSATYHDLRLERGRDGVYHARVVIDV